MHEKMGAVVANYRSKASQVYSAIFKIAELFVSFRTLASSKGLFSIQAKSAAACP
jgi:hypothetical protein